MKIWFDTEFDENGSIIEMISIGMVREDGATYYAESAEYEGSKAHEWLQKNVIPNLTGIKKDKKTIAKEIVDFCGINPEFWAYFGAYDWVVLCQLYGTMMQLPQHFPMYVLDIMQIAHFKKGIKLPSHIGRHHNALDDALWTKKAWECLILS